MGEKHLVIQCILFLRLSDIIRYIERGQMEIMSPDQGNNRIKSITIGGVRALIFFLVIYDIYYR